MKRINYIMAAIMVAAISSCAEKIEEPTPGASRNDYVAPVEGATFSLVASSSEENDAPTKALFDGNQLVWNAGDALSKETHSTPRSSLRRRERLMITRQYSHSSPA